MAATPPPAEPAPAPASGGVVRGTLQYASGLAWGLYSAAEQIGVVKSAMDLAKPLVPIVQPVYDGVIAVGDPWVDWSDNMVNGAWQTVSSRVFVPAAGAVAKVQQVATLQLHNRYAVLVDSSDRAVDALLPEIEEKDTSKSEKKEQEGEHAKSLGDVTSKASKRVTKKLENHWKDVRALSAGSMKEIVQVDLIECAENGFNLSVSLVENNVRPIVEDLAARKVAAAASTESVYVSVVTVSDEKSKLLWDAIARYRELSKQKLTEASKFASDKVAETGIPVIVGKAKEVSVGEVSEFVLVRLNLKEQSEQFVLVERKLFDVFNTTDTTSKKQPAKSATKAH